MFYVIILLIGIALGLYLSTTVAGQKVIGLMQSAETKIGE